MIRGIDHMVIAVPDLAKAQRQYEQLGFTVVTGGRHPTGTHNALIGFADGAYIELLAFYEADPQHRWWSLMQAGGGLVDFCAQTDDIQADINAWRRVGVQMGDVWPLSRTRPDGYRLEWVLSTPPDAYLGAIPFLIEDSTPRDERVPPERRHANGVMGIAWLQLRVPDLAAVRSWYEPVLGQLGVPVAHEGEDGVQFRLGQHQLWYFAGDRIGLEAAAFHTSSGVKGALDPTKTQGAKLYFTG